MSLPPNRLSQYRSYSYHHMLLMCDRTTTAQTVANSPSLDTFMHPPNNATPIGKHSPKTVDTIDDGVGKYCVIINGMVDADFVITNASWVAFTAGETGMFDEGTSIGTEGKMQISEPLGVIFADTLVKCAQSLNIDASEAVFVLKTVFQGWRDNDREWELISDIPALQFIITNLGATFSVEGGNYLIEFVALANGKSRLPQYSRALEGVSVLLADKLKMQTGQSSTLQDALQAIEIKVNESYKRYAACVLESTQQILDEEVNISEDVVISAQELLYPVRYEFKLGQSFTNPENEVNLSEYVVSNQPIKYINQGSKCEEPVTMKNNLGVSVEDMLHQLMKMCPKIQDDMTQGDNNGVRWEYKINSFVKTTGEDSRNRQTTVIYTIDRFPTPSGGAIASIFANKQPFRITGDTKLDNQLLRNILIFDYIYTGNNTDILEFDIKMNMGLHYFQIATNANSISNQQELPQRSNHLTDIKQVERINAIVPRPLFFGTQIRRHDLINTRTPQTTSQAGYTLSKHASLEVLESTIRIHGNPRLLGSTNRNSGQEAIEQTFTDTHNRYPADASIEDILRSISDTSEDVAFNFWGKVPQLVRINIRMPQTNDNITNFQNALGTQEANFSKKFWFEGYYYAYAVEHMFDNGEFTQQLMMIGLPPKDLLQEKKATGDLTSKQSKFIESCYECVPKVAPENTKKNQLAWQQWITERLKLNAENAGRVEDFKIQDTQMNEATSSSAGTIQPTTRDDNEELISSTRGPDQVKLWNDKDTNPRLREGILLASSRTGVNPQTLAQIGWIESRLGRNTIATTSSARGPFQFIEGTWLGIVDNPNLNPGINVQGLSRAQKLALRDDPTASSLVAATLLKDNQKKIGSDAAGDLYLAHFLGANNAKRVIQASASGNGNLPLSQVLVNPTAVLSSNPQLAKEGVRTVDDIRHWAAKKMAQSLNNGVPVAAPSGSNNIQGSQQPTQQRSTPRTAIQSVGAVQTASFRSCCDAVEKILSPEQQSALTDPNNTTNCNTEQLTRGIVSAPLSNTADTEI